MTVETSGARYRERLLPSVGFFVALLLLIPAVALVMTPINASIAWPLAVALYVFAAILFIVISPVIEVREGKLIAGRAQIPVDMLGEIEPLASDALRDAIGPGADARSFLLVRGWIHRGLKITITDPADPTPFWILTSRRPLNLAAALGVTITD